LRVEDDDGTVEDAQAALDLGGEIDVAGVSMRLIRAVAPGERDASAVDRDAALLLLLVPVGHRVPASTPPSLWLALGVEEEVLGGRGLARIDVRDDADVADRVRSILALRP